MAASTGVFQASYEYTLDGKTYTNQLHYVQAGTDPDPLTLAVQGADFGAACLQNWSDNIRAVQCIDAVLVGIRLRHFGTFQLYPDIPPAPVGTPQKLMPEVIEEVLYTTGMPLASQADDDFLPAFNAFRAVKKTSRPGRRWRGHFSLAGVVENQTTGNQLTGGTWSLWQTNSVAFLMQVHTILGWVNNFVMLPCVFSITDAQANNDLAAACATYAQPMTGVDPKRLIGTMRRRKKKHL